MEKEDFEKEWKKSGKQMKIMIIIIFTIVICLQ